MAAATISRIMGSHLTPAPAGLKWRHDTGTDLADALDVLYVGCTGAGPLCVVVIEAGDLVTYTGGVADLVPPA